MTIETFCEKYKLRSKKDACKETIVPGKLGHIYEHSNDLFGVIYCGAKCTTRGWNAASRNGMELGLSLHQNGDSEGSLLFDSGNKAQARFAINLIRASKRPNLSPDVIKARQARMKKINHVKTTRLSTQD